MPSRAPGEQELESPKEVCPSRLSLVFLLVLPVVVVNPWAEDLFSRPKDVAGQVLIVFLVAGTVLFHRQPQMRVPVSPVSLPLVGLLLWSGLSASLSVDPLFGLLEVVHLVLLVVLFHLLLSRRDAGERVRLIFQTMAIVGGVSALYGLIQLVGIDVIHTQGRFVPYSFFGNRNFAAEFILLVLPPALALTLLARSWRALSLWSVVSGLLVLHLATTQTRAALAGLAFGLLGGGIFWWRSSEIPGDPAPSRRRCLAVGAILALGFLLFFFLEPLGAFRPVVSRVLSSEGWEARRADEIAARAYPVKSLTEPGSLRARLLLWQAGLQLIQDRPWTGVGPTNVAVVFPMTYEPVAYWWPEWLGEPFLHNELLQLAAELGVPALGLALWMVAIVAVILRRSLAARQPLRNRVFVSTSLCVLIAIGIDSLFGFPFHLPAHRLYVVIHCASLVALASHGPASGFRMARLSGILVAGAFLLLVTLGPFRLQIAEVYAAVGWEALNRGARAESLAAYRQAHIWFPAMFERDQLFRQALDPRPQYEKAVREFREVLQRSPQNQAALANLGRAFHGAGRFDEALGVYSRLLAMKPGDRDVLVRLIDLALARGRPGEAYDHYRALTAEARCDGRLLFNIGVGYHLSGDRETAKAIWGQAVACDPRLAGLPEVWLKRFAR